MKKLIYIIASTALLISCESRTYEEISDNTPITQQVKYTTDIKPIIDANCISCHSVNGPAAYKPFTNYDLVKASIDDMLNRIQRPLGDPEKMPQGGSLPQSQINIFIKWKADGLIEN
ncbi:MULTISPECIES: c-type cytochrome [Chryseobacterium]|uniref:c-type cytochrome n=1 Tax=Chryseobacterium TaxID=59732 RepID=UPI001BE85312|nr:MULTISPECIES: hypothetical protein [Chryseobacterium]MBT2620776.1 hypothetical protein [Chryseobacterium sp. ISL-6]